MALLFFNLLKHPMDVIMSFNLYWMQIITFNTTIKDEFTKQTLKAFNINTNWWFYDMLKRKMSMFQLQLCLRYCKPQAKLKYIHVVKKFCYNWPIKKTTERGQLKSVLSFIPFDQCCQYTVLSQNKNSYLYDPWCHLSIWNSVLLSDQASFSSSVIRVVLPDGKLSVVAAGGQQSRLLWMPGHAVDVLIVGFGHVGRQEEDGLLWVCSGVFSEHTDSIIAARGGQGTGQTTPWH